MEKIVEIRVKKTPIKMYIEDFSEITFRKQIETNAEIYIAPLLTLILFVFFSDIIVSVVVLRSSV
jgi:hypothetical protein